MAAAKNNKSLGRPALVVGTQQTLSSLFLRLSIFMVIGKGGIAVSQHKRFV